MVLDTRAKWREIGRRLGLTEKDIKTFHKLDDGECLHFTLQKIVEKKAAKQQQKQSDFFFDSIGIVDEEFIDNLSKVLESDDIGHASMAIALKEIVLPESELLSLRSFIIFTCTVATCSQKFDLTFFINKIINWPIKNHCY